MGVITLDIEKILSDIVPQFGLFKPQSEIKISCEKIPDEVRDKVVQYVEKNYRGDISPINDILKFIQHINELYKEESITQNILKILNGGSYNSSSKWIPHLDLLNELSYLNDSQIKTSLDLLIEAKKIGLVKTNGMRSDIPREKQYGYYRI